MELLDLLLPTTDAGVLAQLIIFLATGTGLMWRFRKRPEARLMVVGLSLLGLGAMALRAVH